MDNQTLEELENDFWATIDNYPTALIQNVYLLRKKPICQLDPEDIRLLISQDVGLNYLIPLAIDLLQADILVEGDNYPGDLLLAVLRVKDAYWKAHLAERQRLNDLLSKSIEVISNATIINAEIKHELMEEINGRSFQSNTRALKKND